jgi:hypothetical protein
MKAVVLHYGKIAAMMFAGGVAYIGLGQRMNSQPAAQPLALTLSLLAVLVVAPVPAQPPTGALGGYQSWTITKFECT